MLNKNFQYLIILVFVSFGCSSQKVSTHTSTTKYRKIDNPLEDYTSVFKSSNKFHKCYLKWHSKHEKLTQSLERGKLAVLEAHRQTVFQFQKMIKFYPKDHAKKLKIYKTSYKNLLSNYEWGASPRYLSQKYKELQEKIEDDLRKKTN